MTDVFACGRCGAALTTPVSRIALPVHARQICQHALLPQLMERGTYAVDPEPSAPPWVPWSEVGAEAAARGVFAPVPFLSSGSPGAIVVAPGDAVGTVLIPGRYDGCLGMDGREGPNLACAQCGCPVATRVDDCSYWQAVWFVPSTVNRRPTGSAPRTLDWAAALAAQRKTTPPVVSPEEWHPRWAAAVGAALAHLVAASGGMRVAVPEGLATHTFGRAVQALLPPGPRERRTALAGPGLPAVDTAADMFLVPRHPQTGRTWQPPGSTVTVPLAADVWTHLAFPYQRPLLPARGGLSDEIFRDDPPLAIPWHAFRPDSGVFLHTLARLPAVRQPWLRAIYDQVRAAPHTHPF